MTLTTEKPSAPPLMLAKLEEKRARRLKQEQKKTEAARRSALGKIKAYLVSTVSFMSFLILGGNLGRAIEITYRLVAVIVLWVADWIVYPLRRISNWKILTQHNHKNLEDTSNITEDNSSPFSQASLSIYVANERPLFARRLMIAFQNLGPAFIKLGQIISMLPVVPRSFTSEFAKLCDYLPAENIKEVKMLIEEELGRPVEEIFEYIDPQPIGAASLAQVHCVVLKGGKDAVVKVQRPNLKTLFERDYIILGPFAGIAELVLKLIRPLITAVQDVYPVEILNDYGEATAVDEVDFGFEATIMQMFANAINQYGLDRDLHVPNVYWEYTTERLITMERMWFLFKPVDIDVGKPEDINSFISFIKGMGYNPPLAFKRAYRAKWYPFTRYGVLTMDVHHGNFLYSYDDTLSMVDFGINFYAGASSEIEKLRPGVVLIWSAVQRMDGEGIVAAAKGPMGLMPGLDDEEASKTVAEVMQKSLEPIMQVTERADATGAFITDLNAFMRTAEFGGIFLDLIRGIARKTKLRTPYETLALGRMIPYWATWVQIVDPNWNIMDESTILTSYWYGPDDGKAPYKGTKVYPEPYLPYEEDIFLRPRTEEEIKADDLSLCHAPARIGD
ncbi:MAG: AarF/UbiB family protein [Chloroflexota bacterium]|nr:AarF/UbiB family protein [Chloroflexota bacterium]